MRVIKRDNSEENVSFDKVLNRIKNLSNDLQNVNVYEVAQKVCSRIYNGVHTSELDELAAQMCSSMIIEHPDYGVLASRIIISNHHKNTSPSFSETIQILYDNKDVHGQSNPLINDTLYDYVMKNKEKLNSYIDYERDFAFDYFGFKTLEKGYLIRVNKRVVERPQHMFMRVALGIHGSDIKEALQTYDLMSKKYFVHATPTLFHSGTRCPQNSSCYLVAMESDSIDGIYNTMKDCAMISKYAGGIGLHIHNVRARNSIIRGTNGQSTGIIPMLRVFNATSRYVNQCFTPDTVVYTFEGPKQIKNISMHDFVKTIDGSYMPVNQVVTKHVEKDILEIKTDFTLTPIRCTKEHEIFCIRNPKKLPVHHAMKRKQGSFVSADTLREGDIVMHPIPYEFKEVDVSSEFCRLYGIMIGSTAHVVNNQCIIPLRQNVTFEVYNFIKSYLQQNDISYQVHDDEQNVTNIVFDLNKLPVNIDYLNYSILNSILNSINDKRICQELTSCNPELSAMIVKGMIDVAGTVNVNIRLNVHNLEMAYDVKHILMNMGILAKASVHIENFGKPVYVVDIPRDVKLCRYLANVMPCRHLPYTVYKNAIYTDIKSIRSTYYTGYVYDLNIQDNHNYTTDLGVVHNSGKRNGSIAIFIEPWHADVENFLELKKNHGHEEDRTRDLFLAMWIPDLFMKRVKDDDVWSLMCPDQCPGLSDVYGDEFEKLYIEYESKGLFVKQVKAQDIWFKLLESQIETGVPYMGYKDHVNHKTNQSNIGVIKSSNLCMEICEVSKPEEVAVCNLASVCLPSYVKKGDNDAMTYDHAKLHDVVKVATKNLNKVIDVNFYPVEKAHKSNMNHRPIGIGVQGLADTFAMMGYPFDSDEAKQLNKDIFETMYHAGLEASNELAMKYGPYSTYEGSPASRGILQFDMWGVTPNSNRYDWNAMKERIKEHGLRNSLLLAPMPTASTSQIMGFNEAFEPFTSNIYKRKTLAGEFILVNRHLVNDLSLQGLWTHDIKNKIIINDGSIQSILEIPERIREMYKTVWEIKQKNIIDMAADRGPFICQSQSMNLFMESPDFKKLSSMHFYSWQKGLKTGMYYLRTKPKAKTQQFTIDPKLSKFSNIQSDDEPAMGLCESCSA